MDRKSLIENPINSLNGLNLSSIQSPFQSPFLQVDNSLLKSSTPSALSNEFIFPDGGTKSSRGRFELAFAQIGGAVMSGGAIGGAFGTFKGLSEVAKMTDHISVKRAHLLNHITRNGALVGNTFGSITLIYSVLGVGLSFVQDQHDEINTLVSAASTGAIYGAFSHTKSMNGVAGKALTSLRIKRTAFGFAGGLLAACVIIFALNQDSYQNKLKRF